MTMEPREVYSRLGGDVDRCPGEEDERPEEFLRVRDLFLEHVGEGKILDAGCGPGMDTDYFSRQGFDAVGIDLADGMIEYARENKQGRFLKMDVAETDFDEEEFDGVCCNAAIFFGPEEHMEKVLRELNRILKPGGVLFVTFKIGEGSELRDHGTGEVRQYFVTADRAEEMLEDAGFDTLFSRVSDGPHRDFGNFICRKD